MTTQQARRCVRRSTWPASVASGTEPRSAHKDSESEPRGLGAPENAPLQDGTRAESSAIQIQDALNLSRALAAQSKTNLRRKGTTTSNGSGRSWSDSSRSRSTSTVFGESTASQRSHSKDSAFSRASKNVQGLRNLLRRLARSDPDGERSKRGGNGRPTTPAVRRNRTNSTEDYADEETYMNVDATTSVPADVYTSLLQAARKTSGQHRQEIDDDSGGKKSRRLINRGYCWDRDTPCSRSSPSSDSTCATQVTGSTSSVVEMKKPFQCPWYEIEFQELPEGLSDKNKVLATRSCDVRYGASGIKTDQKVSHPIWLECGDVGDSDEEGIIKQPLIGRRMHASRGK